MIVGLKALKALTVTMMAAFILTAPVSASTDTATPQANAAPDFILAPVDQETPYFTLTLQPGETKKLAVELGNAGESPVEAITYAADAYTLVNGGFGVRSESDPVSGTTTWLDYKSRTLTLKPGKIVKQTFNVTVPETIEPGQYISGLVLQTAKPIAVPGSPMLQQTILKSIAVFITIPGPVHPHLKIGDATLNRITGSSVLEIQIENPGNVLLKPSGSVIISNDAGETIITAPIAMGSVYAGTSTILEVAVPESVTPGTYTAAVDLKDEATGATAHSDELTFDIEAAADVTTPPASAVQIDSVVAEPSRDETTGDLRFVNVTVQLSNNGEPLTSARLTLHVTLDGAFVEDFPLNSSLVVPNGVSQVQQRYLPPGEWAAGTYAFSVSLEAVDPGTGQATVIATATSDDVVTGP
jgi:hypothetical protein